MNEDMKKIDSTNPLWKMILAIAIPAILLGLKSVWNKWIKPLIYKIFGVTIEFPEDAVNKLIDWILGLILEQEKLYPDSKQNSLKLDNVIAKIAREADPIQLGIIKKKWGDIPTAVNSIFLQKAKVIIEAKKAQK